MVERSGFELLAPTLERKVGSSNPLCFWGEADEPERDGERADLADRDINQWYSSSCVRVWGSSSRT